MTRRYYSSRSGKNLLATNLDLPMFLRLFIDVYVALDGKCYFQEAFGYWCVDNGDVPGTLGRDVEAQMFRQLRKPNLWPIKENCARYSEEDIFDVIEFLHDHVSKPLEGHYHNYSDCGWHYSTFNREAGRSEYLSEINEILRDYGDGYELSIEGEVLASVETGMEYLLKATLPTDDAENVESRVNAAMLKFRRYRSSMEDRRDAIRDLADVLEYLRPQLKGVLIKKDESDLFNIANSFGIRHHNPDQKTDYDKAIWYSWMFYYYLATIHAATRLIEKGKRDAG